VLQVLDEAGISIDAVAGTSVGALYGGAYAVGRTSAEMAEGIRTCPHMDVVNFFRHRLKIRHPNRLARRFYEALAGHRIENLPMRFAATASDIVERRHVVIDRGPLIDAVEASIAIPLIARPVMHQGRYLLDGGVWDAAPVDAALALGADVVVSVQLGRPLTLPERWHRAGSWVAERLGGISHRRTAAGVPFTIYAMSRVLEPGRAAHLVIRPPVGRFSANSPLHMKACLDAGIASAREALPAIQALLAGEPPALVAEEYAPQPAPRITFEPGTA
jgi:predicted acylesterase/phospholipase RssA